MNPRSGLPTGKGYGFTPTRPLAPRGRWLRLRRSKRPEVRSALRELLLEGGQIPIPTEPSPWHGRAKTDGQWGRDGEIR